jgi:hypothetical protein
MTTYYNPTETTDIGPAAAPPNWCLPDVEPQWDKLVAGGMVCTWVRTFPANDRSADVWIQAEDQIVDGRVMRCAPRIGISEREFVTVDEARELAAALVEAADVLDRLS